MATYIKPDDAFEWRLNLPPEAVIVLLKTVCVDEQGKNVGQSVVTNTLWGPKSWSVRFNGKEFHLTPLTQGNLHRVFGYEHGTIHDAKFGSRIRLDNKPVANNQVGKILLLLVVGATPIIGSIGVIATLPWNQIWLGLLGACAISLWLAFAFLWLGPATMRGEAADFLDQVFVNHCIPAEDIPAKQLPQKLAS